MKKLEQFGISKEIVFYITLTVALVACIYYLDVILHAFGVVFQVLKPVIYGMVIAFVLNVIMVPLEQRLFQPLAQKSKIMARLKRPLSMVVTFLVVLAILALVFLLVLPRFVESLISLGSYLPVYIEDFAGFIGSLFQFYGFEHVEWNSFSSYISEALAQIGRTLKDAIPHIFGFTLGVTGGLIKFFLGVIFSCYMLAQKENLAKKATTVMTVYLPAKISDGILYVSRVTNETFKSFLGGQCLDSLCLGVITFVVLSIMHMPYALVIAVTVGVTNMIPIIGPILGTIPCAFIILVISPVKALILVITIIVLQEFESKVIYPRIVGGRVGLDGLWVLMAVLVGGGLGGLLGIILGVPTFAVLGKLLGANVEKRLGYCPWERKEPLPKKQGEN